MDIIPFFITGVIIGSIYGLTTLGLSLIFGVLRVANVAHGSFIMIGAYMAFFAFTLWKWPPLATAVLAMAVGMALGYLVYLVAIKPLKKAGELHMLVALFALGIAVAEVARLLWGPDFVGYTWRLGSIPLFGLEVEVSKLLGAILALAIAVALEFLFRKTFFGRAVRAVVQEPLGAQLVGVKVENVYAFSAALGIGITTLGGVLLTLFIPVGINPYMGGPYTLIGFVIAVMGGLGSIMGAYVAGLIFGVIESVGYYLFSLAGFAEPSQMALFTAFVVLLLLLLFRPTGLFRL
ncbi:amino acid/amide ABC transporter membrane protein 1, HAAT family [Pyrobaculum islandicum DSM 4184]|uniref:Amino acid/amide ABC transporter membrane protein 1, HAAT family n=1 Tax=Pyrobaculum islandicum (strain DSM 4184 / JCM 9189 / GEO3) TaxID=384616 RepID=A1RUP6_PYRIL|nr:branched-chain amino acid ABC transporter permease [Pyrobaculum islandicum]ABL88678.1 amino acid/amide ABC transporter membrane protein 1, HAAT family [Pyrobaculum islandicum DSM 4184]